MENEFGGMRWQRGTRLEVIRVVQARDDGS